MCNYIQSNSEISLNLLHTNADCEQKTTQESGRAGIRHPSLLIQRLGTSSFSVSGGNL